MGRRSRRLGPASRAGVQHSRVRVYTKARGGRRFALRVAERATEGAIVLEQVNVWRLEQADHLAGVVATRREQVIAVVQPDLCRGACGIRALSHAGDRTPLSEGTLTHCA